MVANFKNKTFADIKSTVFGLRNHEETQGNKHNEKIIGLCLNGNVLFGLRYLNNE